MTSNFVVVVNVLLSLYCHMGSGIDSMANRSLYRHTHNWFPIPLAIPDTGTQHNTWRCSDLLAALFAKFRNFKEEIVALLGAMTDKWV